MKTETIDTERSLTDASLDFERKKTDVVIGKEAISIEKNANKELLLSRTQLDNEINAKRAESDLSFYKDNDAVGQLREERMRVDELIFNQREQADLAIMRERLARNEDEKELLAKERKQTDLCLAKERDHMDLSSDLTTNLLEEEKAAHDLTRSAVKARDEIIAIVSHDLQDPLAIITMCSEEFIGSHGEQRLTDLEIQWIETIRRHATSMFRLVSDLLDVEYIASGKLQIAPATCNLTTLVHEMLKNFEPLARRQELTLSSVVPLQEVIVYADQERIRQVLANLISNALKFTPKEGSIVVSLAEVGSQTHISVADTGPGIALNEREKIFERYAQLGNQD